MTLFADYFQYFWKYEKIYGVGNLIVLYMNGSFYEIFGIDNATEKIGLAREMSEILGLVCSRRNTSIPENNRSNLLQLGFPVSQLDKYISKLTEQHNFTVVVV